MFKYYKKILLIIIMVLSFMYVNVYADDTDDLTAKCNSWIKEKSSLLKDSYGIEIDYHTQNGPDCATFNNCDANARKFEITLKEKKQPDNTNYTFALTEIQLINTDDSAKDIGIRHAYSGEELTKVFGISEKAYIGVNHSILIPNIVDKQQRFRFVLTPINFKNDEFIKNCGSDAKLRIEITYDYSGEPFYTTVPTIELMEPQTNSTGLIDCTNFKEKFDPEKNNFEYNFCYGKTIAENSNNKYVFSTADSTYAKLAKTKKLPPTIQYKCDAFTPLDKSKDNASDYYSNKSYLLGSIEYIVTGDRPYEYNFGGPVEKDGKVYIDERGNRVGNRRKTEEASCTVKCDEVVTTEYGAPVASKAGLCFEYKVKVTSRVNCHITKMPNKPKKYANYCTPSAGCDHGNGYVDPGAGPTEDYEACIDKCDGGKYTDKCAKKCYNEVYGTSKSTKKTTLELDYANKGSLANMALYWGNTQTRDDTDLCNKHFILKDESKPATDDNYVLIDETKPPTEDNRMFYYDYGYYLHPQNSNILWHPSNRYARFYCMYYFDQMFLPFNQCAKTDADGGGIAAECGCSARCIWKGCWGDVYLNYEELHQDDKNNAKIYQEVVDKCDAYSRCSTTQAEFTIDVDYNYGEKNVNTEIHFPYTQNNDHNTKDTIIYDREQSTVTCTANNPNTTILQANGCYTCTTGEEKSKNDKYGSSRNWYQTEWSFPGTWIHNKTGEISYTPVTKKGWIKYKRKFCIPLDANNVNQKWWNAYYISRYGNDKAISYFDTPTLNDKCLITSCDSGQFTETDVNNLKYNINAHTRKFGLLDWDIDISCFYALNNNFPKHETGSSCTFNDAKCLNNAEAKKIRSVELTNLFPATDGGVNSSPDSTGRTPGFNWSVYATNIIKDQAYTSRPANYVKWVQKKGYNVYSDEYLDYEFNLTKADIQKIKREGQNYTAFNGETMMNSVINYQSSLFRGNNAIIHSDKIPQINALKCNNIKNYRSDECDDFAEDGE